mmetsp:Transcript_69205/g.135842  ORF Transcript_69205/g.135842 Transcript_69205/m.135842 type:complete len:190 (-) Transcript_69205:88-657(-)|eukprot:CAMPEP_0170369898 /NCGR_PEP_ID=MMETSP0117_2-20130122/8227_1 /TAXON_ID=400756 /ORGANISM="Durinskia baltica, Strain CSIRO CS-38" /LENGTH=189 /DNA_ID=CAMNT_0010624645 /DNA_START=90 /DNA_END=659 /DNA_ORIENTATION=-
MASKHQASLEAIKAKHGGKLPSDLYNLTNAELGKILYDLTEERKYMGGGRISKELLVQKILKISKDAPIRQDEHPIEGMADFNDPPKVTTAASNKKRKADVAQISTPVAKKVPRNCLASLTDIQKTQMKRVMALKPEQIELLKHEKDLRPLWIHLGMTAKYPAMTGKVAVVERMKTFAENNLRFHGHTA